jgi:hypothetical protein
METNLVIHILMDFFHIVLTQFFSFWQAGIAEVVYFADKGVHTDNKIGGNETAYVASRKLLAMAGVKVSLPGYPLLLHCVQMSLIGLLSIDCCVLLDTHQT